MVITYHIFKKDHKIVFDHVDDDDDDDDDDIDDEDAVTVNENDFYESNLIENESEQDDDNEGEDTFFQCSDNIDNDNAYESFEHRKPTINERLDHIHISLDQVKTKLKITKWAKLAMMM
jgi:hypothetical protein